MSTLYVVEHSARIGVHKGNLLVSHEGRRTRVPVETVDGVVLAGGAQVSSQALSLCVKKGIRVSALSRNGHLRWAVGGPTQGNVLLRAAQLRAADQRERSAAIARWVVAAKLQNCRSSISRWLWDARGPVRDLMARERDAIADRVRALGGVVDGDRIRGIEGDGTRRYFKCLGAHLAERGSTIRFSVRSRRPPRDEANALMSFLYGLMSAEIVGALESVGLDPQVGYLHGMRPGRPSLALDLLEEFRPSVADRLAVSLLTRRMLRPEHFVRSAGGAVHLNDDGRRIVFAALEEHRSGMTSHRLLGREVPRWTLPTVQATILARHLRGDLPVYAPYISAA